MRLVPALAIAVIVTVPPAESSQPGLYPCHAGRNPDRIELSSAGRSPWRTRPMPSPSNDRTPMGEIRSGAGQ